MDMGFGYKVDLNLDIWLMDLEFVNWIIPKKMSGPMGLKKKQWTRLNAKMIKFLNQFDFFNNQLGSSNST